jgi:hypothetical protein
LALAGCSASGAHPAGGPNGATEGASQLSLFRVSGAGATPGSGSAGVNSIDVAFTALAQTQYFFAQDPTAGGTLKIATSQCANGKSAVASVSPQSGPAAGTTFAITSSAAGTCVVTVSSANGAIGTLFVGVTTTGGKVS